jgi:AraC family transcriptional regulator, activator of mtrCDE
MWERRGRRQMPARLAAMSGRINLKARRMRAAQSIDTLSGLAPLLRVQPQVQLLCRFGAQWAADHAAERDRWAPFHFVTKGACVIELSDSARSILLAAGDIAVLPQGTAHIVRGPSTPADARGPFGIRSRPAGAVEIKSNTEDDPETRLVCGRLRFELAHGNLVLAALPDIICVSAEETGASRLWMLMAAIEEELAAGRPGAEAIAADLASALFVIVVRTHLERERHASPLLALLSHRQIGRAVAGMVNDPARSWSLDELAAHANASRASLVRMFRETVQESPIRVLAELRLELARRKLSTTALPIATIAAEVGYRSESAFSRAFFRRFGERPGEMRAGVGRSAL